MNVFIKLLNEGGVLEEIDLGSLYVAHDKDGFISEIAIEPYDNEDLLPYQPYFDGLDDEIPEVPKTVQIGPEHAFIDGFFDSDEYQLDLASLDDDTTEKERICTTERFGRIVGAAYRLYERTVREEPVFIGYADLERHQRLTMSQVLGLTLPTARVRAQQSTEARRERRRLEETAQRERSLLRLVLSAKPDLVKGFPNEFEIDVCTRKNKFPDRVGRILGITDLENPTILKEDGSLRITGSPLLFTNLMACKMVVGASVLAWMPPYAARQVYQITGFKTLIAPEQGANIT